MNWVEEMKSPLTHARPHYASGNRKLPYMTHRVLCAVNQATDDGRRELSPSNAAKVAERRHIDRAKLRNGCVNSCGQGAQNWLNVRHEQLLTFRRNRGELSCR